MPISDRFKYSCKFSNSYWTRYCNSLSNTLSQILCTPLNSPFEMCKKSNNGTNVLYSFSLVCTYYMITHVQPFTNNLFKRGVIGINHPPNNLFFFLMIKDLINIYIYKYLSLLYDDKFRVFIFK